MSFEDRWYQTGGVEAIFNYFEQRRGIAGNPLVAMPTGTGKSVVIAMFLCQVFRMFPRSRVIMLTHVKELIEQNASKLLKMWPTAPLGIHSEGLKKRDTVMPIIYGGVKSVFNRIGDIGFRDLLLIDEAHMLSNKESSMYQKVIAELLAVNPYLRVIGFTATAFRMKQGSLTDDGLFTDICYDITNPESFARLIMEGYLCPPIPKRTNAHIDVSAVKIVNGEFAAGQLEAEADKITYEAVRETIEYGYNRRSWLMFAAGIDHAEHISSMLNSFGISAAAVHSRKSNNEEILEAHKQGELRALVNVGKLTTGYDHPPIDLIGMLRPTMSPGLWVQMLGRGTRPFQGKENCLVLDFAKNTPRCGTIDAPFLPSKPGKNKGGDAPIRQCDSCGCYNAASARFCINCGYEFKFETKIFNSAGSDELLSASVAPVISYLPVDRVLYNLHQKPGSPDSIKVSYICGFHMFNEWVCLEHPGYVSKLARDWWKQRHKEDPPQFTWEALKRVSELRQPIRIRVQTNKKHPEVLGYEY